MVHTAVVLPRDLLERLKTDGERSERGLGAEIRQRLVADSGKVPRDAETTGLVEFIQMLADSLSRDVGKWHESETAKAAFVAGLLEFLKPEALEPVSSVRRAIRDCARFQPLPSLARNVKRHGSLLSMPAASTTHHGRGARRG